MRRDLAVRLARAGVGDRLAVIRRLGSGDANDSGEHHHAQDDLGHRALHGGHHSDLLGVLLIFGDRFETLREAGSGGMGVVYEARDRLTGKIVALKTLVDRVHEERFEREASVLSRLDHPAIVSYVAHGPGYLAMEWLDGEDLEARIERGALSIEESVTIAARVADAVGVAHALGIVHRDLKPSNVFLVGARADGAKVLDFGLARDLAQRGAHKALTATGTVMGSVGYLAPEQARGSQSIDARCDVFALGCILYECLTGIAAFTGDHAVAVLAKLLVEDAPRVRATRGEVPAALDALVARMLERDPERRPSDGFTARDALLRALNASSASAISSASLRPSSITRDEQRMMAVILVHEQHGGAISDSSSGAATMISLGATPARALIENAIAPFGATLDVAAEGTLIVALRGEGAGTDQATRAARCALAIRAACPGPIVALALGRGSDSGGARVVAGEVIDRAASLLAIAKDASEGVLVESSVVSLLESRFVVASSSGLVVLHGERDALAPGRILLGHVTPFVGRMREMATLEQAFATALVEHDASASVVIGDAGSGKSRLRDELLSAAKRREPGVVVWSAQGDASRAQATFAGASALVRAACAASGETLVVRVTRTISNEADRARVVSFLGEMLGDETDGPPSSALRLARESTELMHDNVTRAWLDFVRAELAHSPLIIVLDDLHWIDAPTVELVDAMLAAHRDKPLLVVAFGRPEALETHASIWSGRGVQTIHLAPLSPRASEKLVRQALAGSDDALVAQLVERAAGNPFVLEELVRARAERESTAGNLNDDVPVGVLALVQMRLEALDPAVRRVLRAASIFGRNARERGIAHLLGDESAIEVVRSAVRVLVSREVLETTREDPELVRFRHDLVRDAAYAMLTESDRVVGHGLAGTWLEASGERDASVLAMHFDRAGDRERAAPAFVRAAEQALEGYDHRAVTAHASRALALGATGEVRGRALYARALATQWRGDCAAGLDDARAAIEEFAPGTFQWFSAIRIGCSLSDIVSRRDDAVVLVTLALGVEPQEDRARVIRLQILADAAMVHFHDGNERTAGMFVARFEADSAPIAHDPRVALLVHRMRAGDATRKNNPYGELEHWMKIRELQATIGDFRGCVVADVNIGYGWLQLGAFDRAEIALRGVIALPHAGQLDRLIAAARHNLGIVLAYRGDFENAVREETAAIDAMRAAHDVRLTALSRVYLATIQSLAGDLDSAETSARTALLEAVALPPVRVRALAILVRVLVRRDRKDEALAVVAELTEVLRTSRGEGDGVFVELAIVEAQLAAAMNDEAREALRAITRAINTSAARIADAEVRAEYLRMPDHVRALELAARVGVPSA